MSFEANNAFIVSSVNQLDYSVEREATAVELFQL